MPMVKITFGVDINKTVWLHNFNFASLDYSDFAWFVVHNIPHCLAAKLNTSLTLCLSWRLAMVALSVNDKSWL